MPNGSMSVTELRGLPPISPAARRSCIGAFLSPAFYIVYNLTLGALSDSFVQWVSYGVISISVMAISFDRDEMFR